MSANTTNVSFRIDRELKNQADKLFAELGLNMTTAFNIFLRQAIREGGIPFSISMNAQNADVSKTKTLEDLFKDYDGGTFQAKVLDFDG